MKTFKFAALFAVVGILCAGLILAVPAKKDDTKDTKKRVYKSLKGDAIVVHVDLSGLEKSLEALENITVDLKGLEHLKALENIDVELKGLEALENLKIDLKGLEGLRALENLDVEISGLDVLENLDGIIENSLQNLKHLEVLEDLDLNLSIHRSDNMKKEKKEKK